jgi:5-methylcytosine-specific restriction endonuclease McrA
MGQEVLVLNSDYEPLNVCNVRRAMILVYLGKADILHTQAEEAVLLEAGAASVGGRRSTWDFITAEGQSIVKPSVVKLRQHVRRPLPELKLSRRSIFARDNYTCQYCGVVGRELTIDHVNPKRYGGPMSWENLVTCCRRCNTKKGDKTAAAVGLKLTRQPRRPRYTPYIALNKYVAGTRHNVWKDYLPIFTDIAGIQ